MVGSKLALAAAALSALACIAARAAPAGYLDTTKATLTTGKLQTDSASRATVNFTVANTTDQRLEIVAVQCTALVGDDPVETNADPVGNVGPHEKAYGSVDFFELHGRAATASCRIEYIKLDAD